MKMTGWMAMFAITVGVLACDGSGGLGSGGACGAVEPCGGNIVGNWKFASACGDDSLLGSDATDICATATLHISSITGDGGIVYGANGTYQSTGDIKIGFQLTVPMTCFATDKTCADLDTGFSQEMQQDMTITSHACAVTGSSCVCTIVTDEPAAATGTYTTVGTSVTSTPTGGQASSDLYCVDGNTLHDINVDTTMQTSMGMAKIVGDLVFTK
ncbi:MAG TPA: hypothetical protein VH560_03005 [Polyangia bacterium]|jgi:hypothetical protein|nr:hypothetical protein [Polyangia bacterium]